MHVRVLLSRYRSYTECPACHGARLKPESLLWRLGPYNMQALALLPVARAREFFHGVLAAAAAQRRRHADPARRSARAWAICARSGLSYLTLDRQSRTLSGGEVQRINLTTALGTSLVNTLFVLDEPSIGLHPRDMGRVIGVMQKLRDAGNTLVVVEHDPQIMFEADRLIDMGPGAGEHGGEILFNGTPRGVLDEPRSLTGEYLSGRRRIEASRADGVASMAGAAGAGRRVAAQRAGCDAHACRWASWCASPAFRVRARARWSPSCCTRRCSARCGKPAELAGSYTALRGHDKLGGVVLVDQSPIGRTTRSNPASFVGAFDPIRQLFAKLPEAALRKYTPGTFSFNSGNGRCPECGGNGFEHVEMQLLADVYLRCPACNGRRYPRRDPRAEDRRRRWPPRRHRQRAGDDGHRSRGLLRAAARGAGAPAAAGRCGPVLPAPGPAGAHAVGRRGAAPEARRPSGGHRQPPSGSC